jgi:hypothetical protein
MSVVKMKLEKIHTMEEIYSCLDRLQRALESKFKLFLTDLIIVNQKELLDLIEEVKECVPEELELSVKIKEEANSIIEKAKKQADEISKKYNEVKLEKIKSSLEVQESSQKAIQKLSKSRRTENTIINEIQEYSQKIFDNIEEKLNENIKNVRTARELLKEKKLSLYTDEKEEEEEHQAGEKL